MLMSTETVLLDLFYLLYIVQLHSLRLKEAATAEPCNKPAGQLLAAAASWNTMAPHFICSSISLLTQLLWIVNLLCKSGKLSE
jgi:hypothetical protein